MSIQSYLGAPRSGLQGCLRQFRRCLGPLLLVLWAVAAPASFAQATEDTPVAVRYVGQISLERLSAGEPGRGAILYYIPERGPEHPSLVVVLSKEIGAASAQAEVYDALPTSTEVPVRIVGDSIELPPNSVPRITITALDGWWVRDGRRNYNLDVVTRGPIVSMWGTDYKSDAQPYGWITEVGHVEPAVRISIRDPQGKGLPNWETRSLIPSFPGRGYIRYSYAENRCDVSRTLDPGVSPEWPLVATSGQYELSFGALTPPIIVDWERGRITHFSEVVTVRRQRCSYSLYSIAPITPGAQNQPDFETPFAFYDFSGQDSGRPNLIIRTERYPANDPWSTAINSRLQRGRPVPDDLVVVRYSWRNQVGDGQWDYAVNVLGSHPYTATTSIAGGTVMIDAPSYEQFPSWVTGHSWPLVTFIDTEGSSYPSTEGIYDWSPLEAGIGYVIGWENEQAQGAFGDIRPGFRGEYRLDQSRPPMLYFSPLDQRLHLLGANGGLWRLDDNVVVRTRTIGGEHINSWTRIRTRDRQEIVEEQLYALTGYLLHVGDGNVTLRAADVPAELFRQTPPTDAASWASAREQITAASRIRRDPNNLGSWLADFPGENSNLSGARVLSVRSDGDTFRILLELLPGATPNGPAFDLLRGQKPGRYVLSYDGEFRVTAATPPDVTVDILNETVQELRATTLQIGLANNGDEDVEGALLQVQAIAPSGAVTSILTDTVTLLARQPLVSAAEWIPPSPGVWKLEPRLTLPDGEITTFGSTSIEVVTTQVAPSSDILQQSSSGSSLLLLGVVGVVLASLSGATMALVLRAQRERQM